MKGFTYDHTKRMWYKHSSTCHNAPLKQKMLYLDKVVTDPDFKITTDPKAKTITKQVLSSRKWWQLWKPRLVTVTETTGGGQHTKNVCFRYYCTKCNKQNNGEWEFIRAS